MKKAGFIGTGTMGSAMARAAISGVGAENVIVSNRTVTKAVAFSMETDCAMAKNNLEVARESEIIVLCVKPQGLRAVLEEIAPVLAKREDRFILVSLAVGITMEKIREYAGGEYPVVRMVPNTPVQVGCGYTVFCCDGVTEDEKAEMLRMWKSAGEFEELGEGLLEAAGVLSGCGPAYMYLCMEAMADGGVLCGLPRASAVKMAASAARGAAELVLKTGRHTGELRDAVCSPGGSTIRGVAAMEDGGVRAAMIRAVRASYERTKELGG